MARKPGETFPSDHRRWFRLYEDLLDDPALNGVSADVFRFYVRLLAMLNRTKQRDGKIRFDRFALNACAMREQRRHALAVARSGAEAGLFTLSEEGADVLIQVPKWAELQGVAPAEPQRDPSGAPPTKTKTKTKTKTTRERGTRSPVKLDGEPPARKPRKRQPQRPCPDHLETAEVERVWSFVRGKIHRDLSADELEFAWTRLRLWAQADDVQKRDWVATFQNALAKGWPLEGYGHDPRLSNEERKAERTKRAARAAVQRATDHGESDPIAELAAAAERRLAVVRGGQDE